jgi:hypothetical protein
LRWSRKEYTSLTTSLPDEIMISLPTLSLVRQHVTALLNARPRASTAASSLNAWLRVSTRRRPHTTLGLSRPITIIAHRSASRWQAAASLKSRPRLLTRMRPRSTLGLARPITAAALPKVRPRASTAAASLNDWPRSLTQKLPLSTLSLIRPVTAAALLNARPRASTDTA